MPALIAPLFALLAQGLPGCPLPPLPRGALPQLTARAQEIARELGAEHPACAPELALALGEHRILLGQPEQALPFLVRAATEIGNGRGRAFLALGRAQAAAGNSFEALRSLATAERLIEAGDPLLDEARLDATLIGRFQLRRGGTVWGAWRHDPEYARPTGALKLAPVGIALLDGEPWLAGKRGAVRLDDGSPAPAIVAGTRVAAIAASPLGRMVFLLEDGFLVCDDGTRFELHPPDAQAALRSRAIALSAGDELGVVAQGRVHVVDLKGQHLRSFEVGGDALDIAADGRGQWHVLLGGDGGIVRIGDSGEAPGSVDGAGTGWSLKGADAVAADRFGSSYVLHRAAGTVLLFDPAGRYAGHFEAPANDRNLLRRSRALAVGRGGEVYLLGDRSVERFR